MYVENLKRNPRYRSTIEDVLCPGISGAEYLQGLLCLINDPAISLSIDAAAQL